MHLPLVYCNSLYLAMLQRIMAEGFTIQDTFLTVLVTQKTHEVVSYILITG